MGTPILTPDWIHKAWQRKDNTYVCANRKSCKRGLISCSEYSVVLFLCRFKCKDQGLRGRFSDSEQERYRMLSVLQRFIKMNFRKYGSCMFQEHMLMPGWYLCWEGWRQPSACSNFHAGDEEFRMAFKVPPFQDCVLSFLGFSEEEKSNMEERTLKHGTEDSSLNLLRQLLLTNYKALFCFRVLKVSPPPLPPPSKVFCTFGCFVRFCLIKTKVMFFATWRKVVWPICCFYHDLLGFSFRNSL